MTDLYFTKEHEWILVDGQQGTVGITNFAQGRLGDIVFVDLPDSGHTVTQGQETAVIESVKAASDVYTPVSGRVTETNAQLTQDPGLVNRAAESDGWLFRITLSNPGELASLMRRDEYAALTGTLQD
ncbi:glycine cleavage system protein GcvH [Haematospirillum jordaniae]|uniref:Glycine cleavage system H protein n=1 Tax=Haematospirillum jordaniae TaxID=1549855 RepID=A0A143DBZ1_9PROT|nr:glycine cleavage system protein GcvH [Haematospirillum jordaniae]AMW34235.1 glycine cleavage system protein H [Haematospirillum jordaniae]NKD45081.1 glycine cleavage system protein GcvH [Haematospirillum jordaniae]NKD57100.1 glycine cleavage system protein GcvH [Haematospirillum jordaniae]NKD59333.1 glycine cleavage system protein GcvH [Haematospirillum jordaniae]NKD67026.1 glycine cleavage system protein GcvH [Haematospirillum jordaniae]